MSAPLTPRRLQRQVEEWREARMQKWAARLQIHSAKSREVSASVFGVKEEKRVHLPTPPSAKPSGGKKETSSGLGKKSLSYGDVHNYQQQRHSTYSHDYNRNGGGMSRQEPRSPYGYHQGGQAHHQGPGHYGHHQPHHPRSPHYNSHDYRNQNVQRSGSSGYRNSYAPAVGSGYRSHPHPSSSNYNRNNTNSKGGAIRKTNDQPHGSKQGYNSERKDATPRKSLAPKERTVTFEDEKKEASDSKPSEAPKALDVPSSDQSSEVETKLNSTFNVEEHDNAPGDDKKPDESVISAPVVTSEEIGEMAQICKQDISAVESSIIEQEIIVSTTEVETVESICDESVTLQTQEPEIKEKMDEVEMIESNCAESATLQAQEPEIREEIDEVETIESVTLQAQEPEIKEKMDEDSEEAESSFRLCLESDSNPSVEEVTVVSEEVVEETGEVFYPAAALAEVIITQQHSPAADNTVVEVETSSQQGHVAEEMSTQQQVESTQQQAECTLPESQAESAVAEKVEPLPSEDVISQQEPVPVPTIQVQLCEDDSENRMIVPSTPEPKKSPVNKKHVVDEVTENLDALYITPGRLPRKSRVLVDSTNVVESSSIKYVVRDAKHKEGLDVVVTPVRRSNRLKKAETPGSTIKSGSEVISPEVLRKAKIVPNPFLNQ